MPGSTTARSSRNCYVSLIPMSERQQMKLVRQLETCDGRGGNSRNLKDSLQNRPRSRSCNGRGETPLHKAAIKGDEELVIKLLEEGADPNTPDFAGWTPLHEACNHGWYGVALALVQAGASVNATGFDDDTPLHDAAINGHSKLVRLLLERGADIHFRNKGGKTPCDVAAPGLVPYLLTNPSVDANELVTDLDVRLDGDATEGSDPSAISERRSAPSQAKVDKDSSSVTLRLHSFKKKAAGRLKSENLTSSGSSSCSSGGSRGDRPVAGAADEDEDDDMDDKGCKEDVYEFKSSKEATPVRGNSTSPDVDKTGSESKAEKPGEGSGGPEPDSAPVPSTKRSIADVVDGEDPEDDTKKKKRKEKEGDGKETGSGGSAKGTTSTGRVPAVRNVAGNAEKGGKMGAHVMGKASGGSAGKNALTAPASNLNSDRKSPSSPKPSSTGSGNGGPASSGPGTGAGKAEPDAEDGKVGSDGEKMDPGPKVPPLKIVIPQQTAAEPEPGTRNGKNSTSRHHQALPYVVTTNNSSEGEKEGPRSRSASPAESVKSEEKKDPAIGMLSAEDQKNSLHHQRVLRSSHRSGPAALGASTGSGNSGGSGGGSSGSGGSGSGSGSGDGRSQDSAPRSSNGNGQGSGSNSSTSLTVTNNSNNGNSNAASPSADNLSPQSQSRTSPQPQGESNASGGTTGAAASTDSSSSGVNSSNFRPNATATSKSNSGSTGSSTTTSASSSSSSSSSSAAAGTAVSEDKTPEGGGESASAGSQSSGTAAPAPVELHPRKRKLKHNKEVKEPPPPQVTTERCETATTSTEIHPHEQPVKNCYQLFLDIRKQIDRRRKGLFPVQPKPPQGFKDYLMNRCTYVLAGNASTRQIPSSPLPPNITSPMKDLFVDQEKERHRLRLQHVIEKEKLVLSVEQEILRVHGRAARALANQSLPFSACTILKDEEVYNLITPEQEEKDRNARSRYNGRLFLSWLQDVDDKWEKIKEAMLLRHHNEAESLHAVQKMDWEWKMKELGFCEFKSKPVILDNHVPMVHVSDDFDLLPA